jgi:hypothetical protein
MSFDATSNITLTDTDQNRMSTEQNKALDYEDLLAAMFPPILTASDDAEINILRNRSVAAAVICLYMVVIVLGSVGSLLVILSIVRSRLMWTATNVFIANLALSDLFVCAIDLPISLHYQASDYYCRKHV